jgi:hypothetical protein
MAKPTGLTGRIRDANAWISIGARLWQVLTYLGVSGWLSGIALLVMAAIYAAAVNVLASIPWYVYVPLALATGTLALHFYIKFRVAWSLRGIKTFDIEDFAKECISYYQDFADFMVNRQEARPRRDIETSTEEMHRVWQEDVKFSRRTDALIMQRFAPRAFAIAHQMKSLGIPPPNMFHFSLGDHGGVGPYIGIVGELLRKGLLDEARKLDPKVTWSSSFR